MNVVVAHLYPEYLNIYADRGNLAVLAERHEAVRYAVCAAAASRVDC